MPRLDFVTNLTDSAKQILSVSFLKRKSNGHF